MVANQGGKVSELVCKEYVYSISEAIQYMHSRNIIHRDLKPENILISVDGTLKVADFGCAVLLPPPSTLRYTFCGTPDYLAPEMIHGTGHGFPVDMWAIGILIHDLMTGR